MTAICIHCMTPVTDGDGRGETDGGAYCERCTRHLTPEEVFQQ